MKILFFTSHPEKYGSQLYLVELIKYIARDYTIPNLTCTLCTSFPGELNKILNANHIENFILPMPPQLKLIMHKNFAIRFRNIIHSLIVFPLYILKFRHILLRDKYDIIYNNNLRSHFIGSLAALGTKTKVILHIHGMPEKLELRHRLAAILAHKVIFNSSYSQAPFMQLKYLRQKYSIVYNGIHLETYQEKYKPEDHQAPVIGVIGAIRENKGQIYAIQAIKHITGEIPNVKLKIIGEKPSMDSNDYINKLKEEIKKNHLGNHVEFPGYLDIYQAINSIDIMLLPTLNEAFGRVLIEAMALKKPVIASNLGGVPEIIEHDKNGLLIPPKDPKAIADAVLMLSRDKEKVDSFIQEGLKTVKSKFTIEKSVKDVLTTLKKTHS